MSLDDHTPSPGDLVVCIECLEISQFAADLTLEPFTEAAVLGGSLSEIQAVRRLLVASREQPLPSPTP